MKVQVISFRCVLKDKMGKVLSSTVNQDVLTGARSGSEERLVSLDKGLQNIKEGEKRRIVLSAAEAYGFYDPEMVITLPRQALPESNMGDQRPVLLTVDGKQRLFRVIDVSGESITLDGNHPLAGQDLVFEIEALTVRDATPEEISEALTPLPSKDERVFH
jgi:FKBP-type peptidyl-prolyl cis-trans isomerase SlyD